MKDFSNNLFAFVVAVSWLAGIVLAAGKEQTLAAVFIPVYAWYLLVERLMQIAGLA